MRTQRGIRFESVVVLMVSMFAGSGGGVLTLLGVVVSCEVDIAKFMAKGLLVESGNVLDYSV